ncbi:protein kinase C-binding protein 1 isoform X2 [Eurytemora carolleeae]|nr:protein kinase C-binding protein 1 isoform X2 [Eurytemora carolleeae]|eukprot:XP_023339369.1 protein kinase C-binding protein 1-like isoform X2 [Eurytemora affinis]
MDEGSEILGFVSDNLLEEFSPSLCSEPAPTTEPDPVVQPVLDTGINSDPAPGCVSEPEQIYEPGENIEPALDSEPAIKAGMASEPNLNADSAGLVASTEPALVGQLDAITEPVVEEGSLAKVDTLKENGTTKRKLEAETEESVKKPRIGSESPNPTVNMSQCEVSSSSPEKLDSGSVYIPEETISQIIDPKPTNPTPESETNAPNEEDQDEPKEEEMDQTANKLKASGISISLIKKRKEENGGTDNDGEEKESEPEKQEQTNPLEVGPNISVTMISKGAPETQNKFTLSLKSQSELLDPKKSETKSGSANMLANGVSDAISVSRITKSPSISSPAAQSKTTFTNSKPMLSSPPGIGLHRPLISQPGHGPPGLQSRPNGRSSLPLATGSVSEQLNVVASGIAEYMRHGIEEVLRELSAQGSQEATIKGLQLELEKMQWRHQQELAEVKQGIDIMLKDMKTNMAKDSQRTIEEFKKQAEMERQKAILETKKKQWCSHCGKEAIFYCCWNTSYCDYPCQQAHWPAHMATCSQSNQEEESQAHEVIPEQKPIHAVSSSALLNSLTRQTNSMAMNTMNLSNSAVGMGPGMGFVMPGMGMGMRPGMGMRSPMGVSIRPGMPGQLTISRPYFM